jgi:hypothetical protein
VAVVQLARCEHFVCGACVAGALEARPPERQGDYCCPCAGCGAALAEKEVKALLPEVEHERFVDLGLRDLQGGTLATCPAGCGWGVMLELSASVVASPASARRGELGVDGQPISAAAATHKERFRFRCRRCKDTEFCAGCRAVPYHLGFTCQSFVAYKASRQCRFCGSAVPSTSRMFLQPGDEGKRKACVAVLRARGVDFARSDPPEQLAALCEATAKVGGAPPLPPPNSTLPLRSVRKDAARSGLYQASRPPPPPAASPPARHAGGGGLRWRGLPAAPGGWLPEDAPVRARLLGRPRRDRVPWMPPLP